MSENNGKAVTEVVAKARRRTFTAEYKQRILKEVDACKADPGAIGTVLRREGLYSSHLTTWRRDRAAHGVDGLKPKRRGPKPSAAAGERGRIAELEKELSRWKARAERAEVLCDIQKKVSSLLGIPPPPDDENR